MKVGDLVMLKGSFPLEAYPCLKGRHGIIIDTLEDDFGIAYFEVDFIDERSWFTMYEIQESGASVAKA